VSAADNTMRAEFIAWHNTKFGQGYGAWSETAGRFEWDLTQELWLAWQAARAGTARMVADAVAAEREAFTRTCRAIEEVATTKANRLELLNPMRSWHDGKRASAEFLLSWISARSTTPEAGEQR